MQKEWLTAKELVGLKGLPMTTQGINAMARRENWLCRKRRGIQGKALEYHINSLPEGLFEPLLFMKPLHYIKQNIMIMHLFGRKFITSFPRKSVTLYWHLLCVKV